MYMTKYHGHFWFRVGDRQYGIKYTAIVQVDDIYFKVLLHIAAAILGAPGEYWSSDIIIHICLQND
jgi:hypothetical protein